MLMLAVAKHGEFPCFEKLMDHIVLDIGARRERWGRMREANAVASMGCVLLLQELLRRSGVSPEGLTLAETERGRPFLEGFSGDFNLSHSDTYSACALLLDAPRRSVGVDIEDCGKRSAEERDRIARRFFCEQELARYNADPTEREFFRLWTGKEASVKQTGQGLSDLSRQNILEASPNRLISYELSNACLTVCVPKEIEVPQEPLLLRADDLIL